MHIIIMIVMMIMIIMIVIMIRIPVHGGSCRGIELLFSSVLVYRNRDFHTSLRRDCRYLVAIRGSMLR